MIQFPGAPSSGMIFILAIGFVFLSYEFYVLYYKKETISVGYHKLARNHPFIILLTGILLGHWLW